MQLPNKDNCRSTKCAAAGFISRIVFLLCVVEEMVQRHVFHSCDGILVYSGFTNQESGLVK